MCSSDYCAYCDLTGLPDPQVQDLCRKWPTVLLSARELQRVARVCIVPVPCCVEYDSDRGELTPLCSPSTLQKLPSGDATASFGRRNARQIGSMPWGF